jgi:TrmH family RNA methyltransferase
MKHITSRRNPLVAECSDVARGKVPHLLLLDGEHLVAEAITAGIRLRRAFVLADGLNQAGLRHLVDLMGKRGVDVVSASATVMDAISPLRSPSSIVATAELPTQAANRMYTGATTLIVIALDVQDPGNLGAIVRVAEAGGATGVVAAGRSANPFGWKALRGSMGSALRLPIAVSTLAGRAVDEARRRGCRLVATIPSGGKSPCEVDLCDAIAILIGGEGAGIPPRLVDEADVRVTIPMQAPVESLNASVAAAILVYEARRQRARSL